MFTSNISEMRQPPEWSLVRAFLCAEWTRDPGLVGRHLVKACERVHGIFPELSPFRLLQVIAGACAPALRECRFLCYVATNVWMEEQRRDLQRARFQRDAAIQPYTS